MPWPCPVASTAARCLADAGGPSPAVAVAPSPKVAAAGPEVAAAGPEVAAAGPEVIAAPGPEVIAAAGPEVAAAGPEVMAAAGPEVAAPGPEVMVAPSPKAAAAGPEVAAPGPKVAPGAISVVAFGATGAGYPVTLVAMPGVGAAAVPISDPVVTPGPGLSGWPPGAAATAARLRHGVAVRQRTASEATEHRAERRPRLGAIGAIPVLRAGVAIRMAGVISQRRAVRSSLENPPTAHGSHPAARARRGLPTAQEPAMRASGDAAPPSAASICAAHRPAARAPTAHRPPAGPYPAARRASPRQRPAAGAGLPPSVEGSSRHDSTKISASAGGTPDDLTKYY